jgi:hypothetical protein
MFQRSTWGDADNRQIEDENWEVLNEEEVVCQVQHDPHHRALKCYLLQAVKNCVEYSYWRYHKLQMGLVDLEHNRDRIGTHFCPTLLNLYLFNSRF